MTTAPLKPNLFFSSARSEKLRAGLDLDSVMPQGSSFPTLQIVLGSSFRGRLSRGSAAIPVDFSNPPEMRGEKVFRGSFTESNGRGLNLTSYSEEGADTVFYVLVRTGFVFGNGGLAADLARIWKGFSDEGKEPALFSHGSVSLSRDSQQMFLAANAGEQVELSAVEAQPLKTVKGFHAGLGMPSYTYRLWRMPRDSGILVRGVTGYAYRIIAENGRVDIKDASDDKRKDKDKYQVMFEALLKEQSQPRIILPQAA